MEYTAIQKQEALLAEAIQLVDMIAEEVFEADRPKPTLGPHAQHVRFAPFKFFTNAHAAIHEKPYQAALAQQTVLLDALAERVASFDPVLIEKVKTTGISLLAQAKIAKKYRIVAAI